MPRFGERTSKDRGAPTVAMSAKFSYEYASSAPQPVRETLASSRSGERTRLACCSRRLAGSGSEFRRPTIRTSANGSQEARARRLSQHARRVRSPNPSHPALPLLARRFPAIAAERLPVPRGAESDSATLAVRRSLVWLDAPTGGKASTRSNERISLGALCARASCPLWPKRARSTPALTA